MSNQNRWPLRAFRVEAPTRRAANSDSNAFGITAFNPDFSLVSSRECASDLAAQEVIKLATHQQAQLRFVHVMENASVFWHDEIYIDAVILQQTALREAGKNILEKAQTL